MQDLASRLSPVADVLRDGLAAGAFPGAAAAVTAGGEGVWTLVLGRLGDDLPDAVTRRTLYDLASLTKILTATSVSMVLWQEGRLDPAHPVRELVPGFRGGGRDAVTLEHLMTHTSGLPAWRPFYRRVRGRDDMLSAILETALEARPGTRTVYSDLGAILWGECLSRITGTPLATLAWKTVFWPLSMRDTLYRPPALDRRRTAPTEFDRDYRGRLVHGEVHDENAHAMGGVSAHAGLFSTIDDVSRFAREVSLAARGKGTLFTPEVVRVFSRRTRLVPGSTRALGWATPTRGGSSGHLFPTRSIGHTGFTGTSLWIDLEGGIAAALLTNRVHPSRRNHKIAGLRVRFHDAVQRAVGRE